MTVNHGIPVLVDIVTIDVIAELVVLNLCLSSLLKLAPLNFVLFALLRVLFDKLLVLEGADLDNV